MTCSHLQKFSNFFTTKFVPASDIILMGSLYFVKIILHVCIRLSALSPSTHLSAGTSCGKLQCKIVLLLMVKMSARTDSHGLPGILCDTVLPLGVVAWKSRHIGQFFIVSLCSVHVDPVDGFTCQQPCLLIPV